MLHTINTLDQLKPILKGFRKSQELTQQDMADMLGVSQQTYQKLESAPQNITIDRLYKVLGLLGIKLCLQDFNYSLTSTNEKAKSIGLVRELSKLKSDHSSSDKSTKTGKFTNSKNTDTHQTSLMSKASKKEEW